jgi:hypothetical protein
LSHFFAGIRQDSDPTWNRNRELPTGHFLNRQSARPTDGLGAGGFAGQGGRA